MAHFRGTVRGNRQSASRLGDRSSGLQTGAAGWKGKIVVSLRSINGVDYYDVTLAPHINSGGKSRRIAAGVLDSMHEPCPQCDPDGTCIDHESGCIRCGAAPVSDLDRQTGICPDCWVDSDYDDADEGDT